MNRKQVAITLGIMCFMLTIAISVQLKTMNSANSTVSQSLTEKIVILQLHKLLKKIV